MRANVNHNITPSKYANIGMLLPYGEILHADLQKAKIGSKVNFYDGTGILIEKTCISVNTEFANALSLQLYGIPIKTTVQKMIDNWKDRMFTDKIIYIVVNK